MNYDNFSDNNDEEAVKIIDTKEKVEVEVEVDDNRGFNKILKEISSYVILIAVAFVAAQLIHHFLFTPVSVEGSSMQPTLHNNDYVFLWRQGNYERFDVVVFEAPNFSDDNKEYYIKRLIGLPGDYIKYENDKLYIDGEYYEETFLIDAKETNRYNGNYTNDFNLDGICSLSNTDCNIDGKIIIPEGYYLVLGDNRPNSLDSTELGLIKSDRFIGEAKYILYPFDRITKIDNK